MKKILFIFALSVSLFASKAQAFEGSWFALGGSFDYLSSGVNDTGIGATMEGGYWYYGNVAFGGYYKANLMGKVDDRAGTKLQMHDLGAFVKYASEAGLYGKLMLGVAFIDADGFTGLNIRPTGTSLSFGLGGGFLFPVSDRFQIGPEVIYRHLTSGNGGDQISVGGLIAYSF